MGNQKLFIETPVGRIAYREAGSGRPVVLVHGLFTSSASFSDLIERLPDDVRAIAVDLPGFGETPLPEGFRPSWQAFSGAVVAFLQALGIDRCALLGHSMGGGISIVTAAHHPELVDRLVLVDAVSLPFPLSLKARLPTIPILGAVAFTVYRREMFRNYFRHDVFHDESKVNLARVDAHYDIFNRHRDHQRACILVTTRPAPVETAARDVNCPTLGIWGQEDRLIPPEIGQCLLSSLANGDLQLVPNCGHSPLEEQPDAAAPLVRNFLQE